MNQDRGNLDKMLVVCPFRGIIYNKDKIGDISKVVAPPYDVISSEQRDLYYNLHPYNIVRIILGKEFPGDNAKDNKYTRAANYFRDWLSRGILKKEGIPSLYIYQHEYTFQEKRIKRRGFVALMRLEELNSGVIFPHERIFAEPQQDRMRLIQNCEANFSTVFSLFSDPNCRIDELLAGEEELIYEFEDPDGVLHQLSAVRDRHIIHSICEFMRDKKLLIADGHHRYLTALQFRDKMKKKSSSHRGASYILMYLLNADSGAVTILPVHRIIKGLSPGNFRKIREKVDLLFSKKTVNNADKYEKRINEILGEGDTAFGMYTNDDGFLILKPRKDSFFTPGQTRSALLDKFIKKAVGKGGEENISFVPHTKEAIREVKEGRYQIAFLLPSTTVEEIKKVALAGESMPPKSSYFYPKPYSGLIMRDLQDAI